MAQEEYPRTTRLCSHRRRRPARAVPEGVHDEARGRDGQSAFRRAFMDANDAGLRVAASPCARADGRQSRQGRRADDKAPAGGRRPRRGEAPRGPGGEGRGLLVRDKAPAARTGRGRHGVGPSATDQAARHAVHRLRPLVDDCARFHDLIRERLRHADGGGRPSLGVETTRRGDFHPVDEVDRGDRSLAREAAAATRKLRSATPWRDARRLRRYRRYARGD